MPTSFARSCTRARTIAIVGLSSNPLRPSNYVGFYLQRHGYRVIPVNPNEREALGETAYPSLADVPVPIDVVDVFRASQFVPEIAEQAVDVGAQSAVAAVRRDQPRRRPDRRSAPA